MTLLDPQSNRTLYTEALTTPSGFRFDKAVALTYSLDLDTLLAIPLHLLLYATGKPQTELLQDRLALLDALRNTADRLSIFHQRGRILAPAGKRVLYSLLEDSVFVASAPNGGVFHPKVWVLRFESLNDKVPLIRLVVLSRNLTADLSWDVSLTVEGHPGTSLVAGNAGLVRLLRSLPDLAPGLGRQRRSQLGSLADELAVTEWDLPPGIDEFRLHALGLDRSSWTPPRSKRLLVISPFCSGTALERLAATTETPWALISRPEELGEIPGTARAAFKQCLVLRGEAETEDGEEPQARWGENMGLHAKLYLSDEPYRTRLTMGSANATNAALVTGSNVEVLAELVGRRQQLGTVQTLLNNQGFLALLEEFNAEDFEPPDIDRVHARRALDDAQAAISAADLALRCHQADDRWHMCLRSRRPIEMPSGLRVTTWPITIARDQGTDCAPLLAGGRIEFGPMDVSSITRFVAFEIAPKQELPEKQTRAFVLQLPADGLPAAEREAAVVRQVVNNRDGFLRYLLFLLGTFDALSEGEGKAGSGAWNAMRRGFETLPLLEEMTRALCRDPARLESIGRLVESLEESATSRDDETIVPASFLELWATFQLALGDKAEQETKA